MADAEGIKMFLYTYLQKNHRKLPQYSFKQRSIGRGQLRFICELRVDGFSYTGIGNSTSKKDAQTNSARDFANFLVREGLLKQSDLPSLISDHELNSTEVAGVNQASSSTTVTQPHLRTAEKMDDSYISRVIDKAKLEEAEEVDLNAEIHGGWSMENSKSRLNEYLQQNKQMPLNIRYTPVGPEHNRSFVAEARVFAKKAQKELYARENGSTKVLASRACCLSLVRQLYHFGEIKAFSGEHKKKKVDQLVPISVELDPDLDNRLHAMLDKLNLLPILTPPPPLITSSVQNFKDQSPAPEEHNMIVTYNIAEFESKPRQPAEPVSWSPPIPNWNPWTACNIDQGPEAYQSLPEISQRFKYEYDERINSQSYALIKNEREALPVANYVNQILNSIAKNQVTLIKGETGCGKTTQVPQFILDSYLASGKGAECAVLVTQPRRLCAISLAERVASERCEAIGISVGYSVRFDTVHPRPFGSILFCTIGTLCRKMEAGIRGVSHIIIDEIHERDGNTDFMLIMIRDLVRANPALRVILMSATIDTTIFQEYFGKTAIVTIHERTFSVQSYFLEDCIQMTDFVPLPKKPDSEKRGGKKASLEDKESVTNAEVDDENCNLICSADYPSSVLEVMRQLPEKEISFPLIGRLLEYICDLGIDGAVLIFLPGWNTISLLRKYLESLPRSRDFLILSLHSQVPREDQKLVFRPAPHGARKIVLSTNISESSITINDVVFVIDSCLARVKMFTVRNNLTSYSTIWASKTNLEQRRGRAGRVRAGFAFHLCSRARFDRLEPHITPEILRTPLHELALMIKLLRLGDVQEFLRKAMISPPIDAVIEAEHTLREMKALDTNDELTPLGMILARLPMEPHLGRMLIFSCAFDLGGAMSVIATQASFDCEVFTMQPCRKRLSWNQAKFAADTHSDQLAMLNAFQSWASIRFGRGEKEASIFCEDRELNEFSFKMIDDTASQIRNILLNLNFPESVLFTPPILFRDRNSRKFDFIAAMLTNGLYPNIAYHADARRLLTAEGKFALIHKGSVNCFKDTKPAFPFFTFTEKIRTQTIYCKSLTMISPIHLLLFGCRRGIWLSNLQNTANSDEGIVMIDDWLPIRIRYSTAARIFALRPALDALLVKICLEPACLKSPSESDAALIELTKALCSRRAIPGVQLHMDECYFDDDVHPQIYRTSPSTTGIHLQEPKRIREEEIAIFAKGSQSIRREGGPPDRSSEGGEPQRRNGGHWSKYYPPQQRDYLLPHHVNRGIKRAYPFTSQWPEEPPAFDRQFPWSQREFYSGCGGGPPPLIPINSRGPPLRSYYSEPPVNHPLSQRVPFPPINPSLSRLPPSSQSQSVTNHQWGDPRKPPYYHY
nr:Dosage compensation regulator [Hymenolepis microstoma]